MANILTLPDKLIERIEAIAEHEGRSVEAVVSDMVEYYPALHPAENPLEDDETPDPNPLLGLVGLLAGRTHETDLSITVRETLKKHTHPQYGWTKRGRTD